MPTLQPLRLVSRFFALRGSLPRTRASLRPRVVGCAVAMALVSTSACDVDEEPELSLELVSTPPEQVSVEVAYPRVRLPAGVALAVAIHPKGDDLVDLSKDSEITVYSDSPEIARPFRMRGKHRFLIVGHQPGEALFQIRVDDEKMGTLRIEVSDNRSPSEK